MYAVIQLRCHLQFLLFFWLYARSPVSCPCRNYAVGLQLIVGKDCVPIGSHTDHGISGNEKGTKYFVACEAGNCKPNFRGNQKITSVPLTVSIPTV